MCRPNKFLSHNFSKLSTLTISMMLFFHVVLRFSFSLISVCFWPSHRWSWTMSFTFSWMWSGAHLDTATISRKSSTIADLEFALFLFKQVDFVISLLIPSQRIFAWKFEKRLFWFWNEKALCFYLLRTVWLSYFSCVQSARNKIARL